MSEVIFKLNNKTVVVNEDRTKRLLDVLRETLEMTGVKEGCGEGECGGCAVLLNHRIVNSCITPLGNVEGKEVITVEGLTETERGKAIMKAFSEFGSVQCGACTPGMVIATESLLNENPTPTEEEIREGLAGNLCRCTGYNMIVGAIKHLVETAGDLWK